MKFLNDVSLTVIGGVGYGILSEEGAKLYSVETPYGPVAVSVLRAGNSSHIAFISRHQGKQHVPPHKINFLALVDAARQIGAPVFSINSVGLMRSVPLVCNLSDDDENKQKTAVDPNDFLNFPFFVPNDFIDFTQNRTGTFYDDKTVHTDMSDPYCTDLRNLLYNVLEKKHLSYSEGVYLCTEGPRFETKAEIQMFAHFADVVGMTGIPEVILAKEAGLCYASLCVITNPAAGLSQNMVTADEVKVSVEKNQKTVFEIIAELAESLGERVKRDAAENEAANCRLKRNRCQCKEATIGGKL